MTLCIHATDIKITLFAHVQTVCGDVDTCGLPQVISLRPHDTGVANAAGHLAEIKVKRKLHLRCVASECKVHSTFISALPWNEACLSARHAVQHRKNTNDDG